ncbi:uncharacterized protein [Leptinotarsa decemlineata]|uniref:uncharacterized protein n=1 Tax=Leptinotarsa decemlineata TaxID=7539 RepID=UPI003D305888
MEVSSTRLDSAGPKKGSSVASSRKGCCSKCRTNSSAQNISNEERQQSTVRSNSGRPFISPNLYAPDETSSRQQRNFENRKNEASMLRSRYSSGSPTQRNAVDNGYRVSSREFVKFQENRKIQSNMLNNPNQMKVRQNKRVESLIVRKIEELLAEDMKNSTRKIQEDKLPKLSKTPKHNNEIENAICSSMNDLHVVMEDEKSDIDDKVERLISEMYAEDTEVNNNTDRVSDSTFEENRKIQSNVLNNPNQMKVRQDKRVESLIMRKIEELLVEDMKNSTRKIQKDKLRKLSKTPKNNNELENAICSAINDLRVVVEDEKSGNDDKVERLISEMYAEDTEVNNNTDRLSDSTFDDVMNQMSGVSNRTNDCTKNVPSRLVTSTPKKVKKTCDRRDAPFNYENICILLSDLLQSTKDEVDALAQSEITLKRGAVKDETLESTTLTEDDYYMDF